MATTFIQWIARLFSGPEQQEDPSETSNPPLGSGMAAHPMLPSYRQVYDSEEKYKVIMEEALDALVTVDYQGRVIDWNRKAEEMFGWKAEEVLGKIIKDFLVPEKWHEEYHKNLSSLIQTGDQLYSPPRIERTAYRKNKEEFPVEVSTVPLKGKAGAAVCLFIRDVTERNKIQKELHEKTRALEESNRALEQFAFMASHDLQEPLRKVIAFGDLLSETLRLEKDTEEGHYLKRIRNSSQRMQKMIIGLLTLSRASTFVPKLEPLDLAEVLEEMLEEVFSPEEQSSIHLDLDPFPVIKGDRVQIGQLFQNLISNGLKFCREGKTPEVRVYPGSSKNGFAEVVVQDNGIGLEKKDVERVFLPFQKLHGMSKYEGSGMGLAICQKIVDKHGGKVTVKSQKGQGTKFFIQLPVGQPKKVE